METLNFTESRKTEENKDFLGELNKSLNDKNIDNKEAKYLFNKFNKIKETVDGSNSVEKKQILAITKNELSEFAKGLQLDGNSSLQKVLNKLIKVKSEVEEEPEEEKPVVVEEVVQENKIKTNNEVKNELIEKYGKKYNSSIGEISSFINNALDNKLNYGLELFNAQEFSKKDGKEGFSEYELSQYIILLDKVVNQLHITGFESFKEQYNDMEDPDFFSTKADISVANKLDFQEHILGEGKEHLISGAVYTEEELNDMREEEFDITDSEKMGDFIKLLGIEIGDGIEDILRFIGNLPAGLVLLPRYINNRIELSDGKTDTRKEVEVEIEQEILLKENPSLMLAELLGEKGIQMIKQLGEMMTSGKNGDIAMLLVTIAGLLAGGAGALKFVAKGAKMGKTAKFLSKVEDVANKVDNTITTGGINKVVGKMKGSKKGVEFTKLDIEGQKKFLTEIDQTLTLQRKNLSGSEKKAIKNEIIIVKLMKSNLDSGENLFNNLSKEQINFFNKKYLYKNITKETVSIKNNQFKTLKIEKKKVYIANNINYPDFDNLNTKKDIKVKINELKSKIERNKNNAGTPEMFKNRKVENEILGNQIKFLEKKLDGLNIYTDIIGDIDKIKNSIKDKGLKQTFDKTIVSYIKQLKDFKNLPEGFLKNLLINIDKFILLAKNKGEVFTGKLSNIKDFIKNIIEIPKIKSFRNKLKDINDGDVINIKTGNSEYVFEKLDNGKFKIIGGSNERLIKKVLGKEANINILETGEISFSGLSTSKIKSIEKISEGKIKEKKVDINEVKFNYIDNLVENFDQIPKSKHAEELLAKYPELKPVGGIEIDGQKILFGKIYNSGYKEIVGFVEVDGKLETRLFYKSNSAGGWRGTPGQHGSAYYKGEHYVTTTEPNVRLSKFIDSLNEIQVEKDISLGEEFKYGEYELPIHSKQFRKETKRFDDNGDLDVFRERGDAGRLKDDFKHSSYSEIKSYMRGLDNSFPKGFIPDYSKGPVNVFEVNHTIAGKTKVEVFEGSLNGKKVEWHMSQSIDNPNQVWISNIRLSDSKINSFGVDSEFINSGILTNKPFDYNFQLPSSLHKVDKMIGRYYDITDILGELKPIREYKEYLNSKQLDIAA